MDLLRFSDDDAESGMPFGPPTLSRHDGCDGNGSPSCLEIEPVLGQPGIEDDVQMPQSVYPNDGSGTPPVSPRMASPCPEPPRKRRRLRKSKLRRHLSLISESVAQLLNYT